MCAKYSLQPQSDRVNIVTESTNYPAHHKAVLFSLLLIWIIPSHRPKIIKCLIPLWIFPPWNARYLWMTKLSLRNSYLYSSVIQTAIRSCMKRAIHSQLNSATLLCDVISDGKKLRKMRNFDKQYRRPQNYLFQSSFTHRELRSSLSESHSFLSLPADITMASSQGTPFLAIHSADEHRMIYSFSDNIMTDVASK